MLGFVYWYVLYDNLPQLSQKIQIQYFIDPKNSGKIGYLFNEFFKRPPFYFFLFFLKCGKLSRKQPSFLRNHLIFLFKTCRSRDKLSAMRQLFFWFSILALPGFGPKKLKLKKKIFCTPQICIYIIKKVLYTYILMGLRKKWFKIALFLAF